MRCGDRDRSFVPVGTDPLACSECCNDLKYKNLKAKGDVDAVLLFQIENFAISKVKTYIDGELVLMEHWVSLNYTALVKILKKHDKRSNLSLRSPFLVSVLQQPFYSTEVLTQLITKTESRFRKLNALIASRGNEAEANGSETNGHLANGADAEDNEDVVATVSTAEVSLSLSRTKAAMECWNGLKDSDSIKRPLGDVPVLLQAKRARSS